MDELKTEQQRLTEWMGRNGHTAWTLADTLGFKSRVSVYRMIHRAAAVSPGFKVRFIERFGIDVANQLFDPPPVKHAEPAPEAA